MTKKKEKNIQNKNENTKKSSIDNLLVDNEIYRLSFENAVDAIIIIDSDLIIQKVSPSFEQYVGYKPDALIGKPVSELKKIIPYNYEKAITEINNVFTGAKISSSIYEFASIDGKIRHADLSIAPVHKGTAIIAIVITARDVAININAEAELHTTMQKLRKTVGGIIQAMGQTIQTRDFYTAGHQQRVANLARNIAKKMGLDKDSVDCIRIAGSIHDLGKISIPAEILSKPKVLSNLEFEIIKKHPQVAYDILNKIEFPWPIADIILQHHERLDGSGYPSGLKEKDILMEARIIAVADVVEAMASHRPYRASLGINTALDEISNNRGRLYDCDAVDCCIKIFNENNFQFQ